MTSRPAARLRLVLLALLLCCCTAPIAHATQDDTLKTATPTELAVIKVLLAQEAAWNKGDLDSFTRAYKDSPDTLFISREVSRGFAGMIGSYKHEYPTRQAMGSLGFSELEVRTLDENFAVVVGKYHLERGKKDGGNADGLFSLVFEKTENGWKIVVDHTT